MLLWPTDAHRLGEKIVKKESHVLPPSTLCQYSKDIKNLLLDDRYIVHFGIRCKYPGSIFTLDLTEFADITNHLQKAHLAFL